MKRKLKIFLDIESTGLTAIYDIVNLAGIIEIDEKIVCLPPTYLDTISPYPDYEGMCRKHTVETLLHKFEHEKDALEKLEFLNRYNTG